MQERVELNKILDNDSELAAVYGGLNEVFAGDLSMCNEVDEDFLEEKWLSLHNRIVQPATKRKNISQKKIIVWAVAAAMLFAVAFSYSYFNSTGRAPLSNKENVVSTRKGSKTNLELPDGTRVWLNAASKISYNENFGKSSRELFLSGEAYFEVAKDKQKPFIVHTASMDIKVTGTVFNVKAYPSDGSSETSLFEGSVEVALKNSEKKIVLKPNEKLFVNNKYLNKGPNRVLPAGKAEADITVSQINLLPDRVTVVETQWTKNSLAFYN